MLKRLASEGGRFLGVGAANTLLSFAVYQGLLFLVPYRVAYTLSFVLTLAFTAVMNARLVFGTRLTARAAVRYAVFYLASYALGLLVVVLLVEGLGVSAVLAPLAAVAVLLPVSFFGSRLALSGPPRR
jgi:putative flippase GtrA